MDKWIKGYKGRYSISDKGKVYSFVSKQWIKACRGTNGYMVVTIGERGVDRKSHNVHRLVAEAFIENTRDYPCVNHKDENKSNNNVSNLEWCTEKYNTAYSTAKTYTFMRNGVKVTVTNLKQYCEQNNLNTSGLRNLLAGRSKTYKGHKQWISQN